VGPARSRPRAPRTPPGGTGTLFLFPAPPPRASPLGGITPLGSRPSEGSLGAPVRPPARPDSHQTAHVLGLAATSDGESPSRWRGPPRGRVTSRKATHAGSPPSTIRTARLQSVARGPPAAYQPGHLPGVLPRLGVGMLVLGRDSRLDAFSGSPVRTWLPSDAAPATTGTPAVRPPRSSRTRGSPPQHPIRPWRIETELSHDVLNPARVPLSWANSPTLGTFSGPRMRRADIEVPNPAVDVDSWAGSACYPRGSFYPLSHGPSTRHRGITRPDFRPCSACPPRSQAPLLPLRAPADCHPA
jgi:hypothetical protein